MTWWACWISGRRMCVRAGVTAFPATSECTGCWPGSIGEPAPGSRRGLTDRSREPCWCQAGRRPSGRSPSSRPLWLEAGLSCLAISQGGASACQKRPERPLRWSGAGAGIARASIDWGSNWSAPGGEWIGAWPPSHPRHPRSPATSCVTPRPRRLTPGHRRTTSRLPTIGASRHVTKMSSWPGAPPSSVSWR